MFSSYFSFEELVLSILKASPLIKPFLTLGGEPRERTELQMKYCIQLEKELDFMSRLVAADDTAGEAIRKIYFALVFDCKAGRRGGGRQKLTNLLRVEK